MALYISQLLGRDQVAFGKLVSQLESMHNSQAIDVQLVGDLIERMAQLHRSFGLDPQDTTSLELYRTLRSRVKLSNEHLAEALGGKYPNAVSEMTPLIIKATDKLLSSTCLAIKQDVAKKILSEHLPTAVMKDLGYKTVDELLESESVDEIMVLARYLETKDWNLQLIDHYQTLKKTDFELRPLKVIYIDRLVLADKLATSIKRHRLVLHSKEMAVVAIAPTLEKVVRGYTIRTLSLVTHYLLEALALSHLLESSQTQATGRYLSECLHNNTAGHIEFGESYLHHRGVHTYEAVKKQTDDTGLSVNDILLGFDERLQVWGGHAITAKNDQEIVSANIIDLSIDESSEAQYARRSVKYLRRDLERELLRRYLEQPSIRRILLMRLGLTNS